jgi:hypothetical protein
MDWIDLAQDRDQWRILVNTIMYYQVPSQFGNFLSSCTIDGFSRRAQLRVQVVSYMLWPDPRNWKSVVTLTEFLARACALDPRHKPLSSCVT